MARHQAKRSESAQEAAGRGSATEQRSQADSGTASSTRAKARARAEYKDSRRKGHGKTPEEARLEQLWAETLGIGGDEEAAQRLCALEGNQRPGVRKHGDTAQACDELLYLKLADAVGVGESEG